MTEPSAATFRTLITGWLLAPRRTVLGMLRAGGSERHHAAFHRLFASARWSIDRVGLAVFDVITRGRPGVFLAVDDTLLLRFGRNIFGTGRHRDPLLSRLSLNKPSAEKWRRAYRTQNELMRQMLSLLEAHVAGSRQCLHLLGDSAPCRGRHRPTQTLHCGVCRTRRRARLCPWFCRGSRAYPSYAAAFSVRALGPHCSCFPVFPSFSCQPTKPVRRGVSAP